MTDVKTCRIFSRLVIVCVWLILAGCSSPTIKHSNSQAYPLSISSSEPAFIFPFCIHGVPGNTANVSHIIIDKVIDEFGRNVLSGQKFYDSVGHLSWTLSEGMRQQAIQGKNQDTWLNGHNARILKDKMQAVTSQLIRTGEIENHQFQFKYVIFLHVDAEEDMSMPFLSQVAVFGGVVDMDDQKIISYIEKNILLSGEPLVQDVAIEMQQIVNELLSTPRIESSSNETTVAGSP